MLKSINSNKKDRGFTIVELLVVIVVIGILAAITIVSYTGITARANASKAAANAQSIQAVAEAIGADNSKYPVTTAEFGSLTSSARIPSGITIGVAAPTAANGTTTFQLYKLTTNADTGGKIVSWDYSRGWLCNQSAAGVTSVSAATDTCDYWGAANATSNYGTTGVTVFAS